MPATSLMYVVPSISGACEGNRHSQSKSVSSDGRLTNTGNSRPHQLAVQRSRTFSLHGHEFAFPPLNDAAVYFSVECVSSAGIFVGVGEDSHAIEFRRFDELAQLFEILIGLAWNRDELVRTAIPGTLLRIFSISLRKISPSRPASSA